MDRTAIQTWASLSANLAFALYHGLTGLLTCSWWFITLSVYYALLSVMRFAILRIRLEGSSVQRLTGWMLTGLSVCLAGTVILCTMQDRGMHLHEIIMITIALYAFTKVTLAIIHLVRAAKAAPPALMCLRNIALADALVSICSLQRSMLVSFGGMAQETIVLFNALTGSGVCIIVFLLGLNLIGGRKINMAKSKLVQANEKIAENVVKGYKAIETSVVEGYKKIEHGVVDGFTRLEDRFVDRYLTRDGETVEEARERLKKETGEN